LDVTSSTKFCQCTSTIFININKSLYGPGVNTQPLTEMNSRNISWMVKAAGP